MTMTLGQSILMIIAVVMATVTTRVLPFIIFPANKKPPRYVQYLGEVLPSAVIGLLVIYCLKDVSFFSGSYGLPEMISISCMAAFYLWTKNSLACILLGTILYMVLVQFVFVA